jgi:hypothetical protein
VGSEDEGGGSMLSEGMTLLAVSMARRPGARRHLNVPAAAAMAAAATAVVVVVAAEGVEDGPVGRAPVKVDSNYTVNFTTVGTIMVVQPRARPLARSRGTGHKLAGTIDSVHVVVQQARHEVRHTNQQRQQCSPDQCHRTKLQLHDPSDL